MLGASDIVAFIPTRDPKKARQFYEKTLGLKFVSKDPFAMVFDAHGVMLRVADVSTVKGFEPHPFTILGWRVSSAESAVRELQKKGIKFERFEGMQQNELGIWHSPSGAHVAWFKDPDGNMLSVTQS
ncbi:MAG TPA: VOC family protein [Tepidisphaeraceae bacterium]|jgi:catechol 2,3-dioxygenase-like lactoylglutathione lyase family enzyme